ncbi:MAG: TerD family protein [Cyclobacteriaceae bacterium]
MVNKILNRLKGKGEELTQGTSFKITEGLQNKISIGLNWSGIPKKGTFNKILQLFEPVDLDGAVAVFKGKELDEVISYKNMLSKNGSMRHSGDDLMGDLEGNDGLDNESIVIDLKKLHQDVDSIYVYLRSARKCDFSEIPYSILRILEVIPSKRTSHVFAYFNLSNNPAYKGSQAMLMGKFERQEDNCWAFTALGEPLHETDLREIGRYIGEEVIVQQDKG